jgi:hypothetical protein
MPRAGGVAPHALQARAALAQNGARDRGYSRVDDPVGNGAHGALSERGGLCLLLPLREESAAQQWQG